MHQEMMAFDIQGGYINDHSHMQVQATYINYMSLHDKKGDVVLLIIDP